MGTARLSIGRNLTDCLMRRTHLMPHNILAHMPACDNCLYAALNMPVYSVYSLISVLRYVLGSSCRLSHSAPWATTLMLLVGVILMI